jgi:hypothetical protein
VVKGTYYLLPTNPNQVVKGTILRTAIQARRT